MLRKATKNNKTLYITKDKEYELMTFMNVESLVIVVNDINDRVVMSRYEFEY